MTGSSGRDGGAARGEARAGLFGLLSLGLLAAALTAVILLHVLRPELSPIEHRMSRYAYGRHSWLMAAVFGTTAGGLAALSVLLARGAPRPRLVPAALAVAAAGLALSAVFRIDTGPIETTEGLIHERASGIAAIAVLIAAVVWSLLGRSRRRTGRRGIDGPLAVAAVALALLSPILHETSVGGLSQRSVWAALIGWAAAVAAAERAEQRAAPWRETGAARRARAASSAVGGSDGP